MTETLRSKGAKLIRGIIGTNPTVAKYWIEATKKILGWAGLYPRVETEGGDIVVKSKKFEEGFGYKWKVRVASY